MTIMPQADPIRGPAAGEGEAGNVTAEFRGAAAARGELDAFAKFFRVDPTVLRQDVRSSADFAINAVAIRREDRKAAAHGKRWLGVLIAAERSARQVSLLNAGAVARNTLARNDRAIDDRLIETTIQQAIDFAANVREVLAQREPARLSAGGGCDQDRLCAVLIERLARVWTRYTNRSAPRGNSGPFVIFVAAAWRALGFADFKNRRGQPQPLVDAIGNRVVKFHRRGAQSRSR